MSECDAATLANDGNSPLQHFRTNRCDRTAWATQITELWFSRFGSHHSFLPAAIGASVDPSTSINIAKKFVNISHWFIEDDTELYQNTFLCHTSFTDSILRLCCSGTISHSFLQLLKRMPEPSNLFLIKSHIYSFFTGEENKYGALVFGQLTYLHYILLAHKSIKLTYYTTKNNRKQPDNTSRKSVLVYCQL
jgi:hypothetical protein